MVTTFITAIHLAALSQIESGDRDGVAGRDGEITRYQILPSEAARELRENLLIKSKHVTIAGLQRDSGMARVCAAGIWEKRVETFKLAYRREPTLQELYLCWHRPGRVLNPRPAELERAKRFTNLVLAMEKQSATD